MGEKGGVGRLVARGAAWTRKALRARRATGSGSWVQPSSLARARLVALLTCKDAVGRPDYVRRSS